MSVVVKGLTKLYGTQKAVDNISFELGSGEILGFLGPNGAGKSTTMKMLTGYVMPNEGSAEICGLDIIDKPLEVRKKIGYLPESNPLYTEMYVREYLQFVASIHKVKNHEEKISELIEMTGLEKEQHKLIGALSKGYKQRVGLAQALIHDPDILILDEPTSGLDMNQLIDIRKLILEMGKEKTIIFSTHIMQEVQALCSRVIIIHDGKLVADDPIDKLQDRISGEQVIRLEFEMFPQDISALNTISGVNKVEKENNRIKIYSSDKVDIRPDVFRMCAARNWVVVEMSSEKMNVEYVFRKLTKESADV
jgi:ABC-2 type transport system ATP-binding protein